MDGRGCRTSGGAGIRRGGAGVRRGDGPGDSHCDGLLRQELVAGEAAVARPTLRVEEAEDRPPIRRPVAVLRDADLGPLPDDLPPETDPAGPPQLEPEARALLEDRPERGGAGRLEDEEERPGPPGEGDEAGQLVGGPR